MISAVVLSHNDEATIPTTLKSIAWCDEVVIVDDESTDKTVEIARRYGATVYSRALHDDFAAQRNFGLSKAKGEWVLFVDSDEIVSKDLAKEIQREIASPRQPAGSRNDNIGFYLKRLDTMWGRELKYGETANVKLLRFAKKNSGTWTRSVHEIWDVKGETGTLTQPLLHYPHQDVAQFMEEINRYSTLNAQYFYKAGVRSNIFHILIYPSAKFFVNYIFRLGFLDGTPGALVAFFMSFHSFLTRSKLWLLSQKPQKIS